MNNNPNVQQPKSDPKGKAIASFIGGKLAKLKKLILIIVILYFLLYILPFILYPGSVGGNFGLRPQSHVCLGFSLEAGTVNKYFPKGDISFGILRKGFEYRVSEDWDRNYCLGQDVWYGE